MEREKNPSSEPNSETIFDSDFYLRSVVPRTPSQIFHSRRVKNDTGKIANSEYFSIHK